jgi:nitroreductase
MDFFEVCRARHSIRAFEDRAVEPDKLQQILEAANAAPSAGNLQAFEIVVVTDPALKLQLSKSALNQPALARAPLDLIFLQDPPRAAATYGTRGTQLYAVQDATIACAHAQLALTALGLASVWIGAFYPDVIRRLIEAPEHLEPVAILAAGYAAEAPEQTERRPLAELVSWERHGGARPG